jgi:hypothetical protein
MKVMRLLCSAAALLVASVSHAAELLPVGYRITSQKFDPGDSIIIEEILATSPQMKVGDTVIVRGKYRLQSRPKAALGFYLTTKGPSGPTRVQPYQRQNVDDLSGSFELKHVVPAEGRLHVSFYPRPSGSSFGGVYFGPASH